MPDRKSTTKKPMDLNELAASITERATAEPGATSAPSIPTTPDGKNAAAVALGRLGGLKGGPARREKLSPRRRKQIARQAALSRWKHKNPPKTA